MGVLWAYGNLHTDDRKCETREILRVEILPKVKMMRRKKKQPAHEWEMRWAEHKHWRDVCR